MLQTIIVFIILLIGYGLLLLIWPKGNVLHEVLHLGTYWIKNVSSPKKPIFRKKYSYGQHSRQYVLLYTPTDKSCKPKNVIYYLHGGGWRYGTPEMFRTNAQILADKGYWIFMASYRRTPKYKYPEIREDLSTSLLKTMEILKEENLLDKKIILGGMSAGANLAALLLYDRASLNKLGYNQSLFTGIFLLGAPLDLQHMDKTLTLRHFAGKHGSSMFAAANPINYLESDESTPVLCIHGKKDGFVPYPVATSFIKKLQSINPAIVEFISLDEGTHLDIGKWPFQKGFVQEQLLLWLDRVESEFS